VRSLLRRENGRREGVLGASIKKGKGNNYTTDI